MLNSFLNDEFTRIALNNIDRFKDQVKLDDYIR